MKNGKYTSKATTGSRPNQATIKTGCEFEIKLRAFDGKSLVVNHFSSSHNHDLREDEFRHHPSQRRLPDSDIDIVKNMVQLKANKKLI